MILDVHVGRQSAHLCYQSAKFIFLFNALCLRICWKKTLFFRKMTTSKVGRDSIPDVYHVQTSSKMYNDDDDVHL